MYQEVTNLSLKMACNLGLWLLPLGCKAVTGTYLGIRSLVPSPSSSSPFPSLQDITLWGHQDESILLSGSNLASLPPFAVLVADIFELCFYR